MSLEDNDRLYSYDLFFDQLIDMLIENNYISLKEDHSPEHVIKVLENIINANKL